MEATLDDVNKYCAQQLKEYSDCIQTHQPHFQIPCQPFRVALSSCASENVPSVRAVKLKCSTQVEAYEQCLKGKTADELEKGGCMTALRDLYECTNAAKAS
ncbi:hypothetical protein HDV05_001880, partial [Chytridiales sp. JEL 0842]